MKKVDISIQNISKVEGHADLDVKVRDGKVHAVHIKFTDNKRFFTQAIRRQNIRVIPQSVARICGTCSIAHTMCAIEAIEKALDVEVTKQTALMKKLIVNGLMIRDHALHMYMFSLPDVFRKDSVLDFNDREKKFLYDAFAVKKAGNMLSTAIGGRAVHAPLPQIGGFSKVPDVKALKECTSQLKTAREKLLDVMDVFYNCRIDYTRKTNFVALSSEKEFDFLEGDICSTTGICIPEQHFFGHLVKTVLPYSQAVGYRFKGKTYMVGALARVNLNKERLHKETRQDARKYLKTFPSDNIFHNNLAQGIEIMHCIDDSLGVIESHDFREEAPAKIIPKDAEGIGVIEAPRGTLFYRLAIDRNGLIKEGNIVVPTQQNQVNMELDIKKLVQENLNRLGKEEIALEIEKLIRAYDPCISCATHFLKVNWV